MKFKTTIRLVTEAKDKNEAMEIAGEYLSGNLTSGVDMKFRTIPAGNDKKLLGAALSVLLAAGALIAYMACAPHQSKISASGISGDYAVQPPLKTANVPKEYTDFKQEWQVKHLKEAIGSVSR